MKVWRNTQYSITEDGRVINTSSGLELKGSVNEQGYVYVRLYIEGKQTHKKIHRLVAELYLEDYDESLDVNHKDGIKAHNSKSNLEMCTRSENLRHAVTLGLVKQGEESHSAKLTEKQARYILDIYTPYSKEFGAKALAKQFNMSERGIRKLLKGETWKHLQR